MKSLDDIINYLINDFYFLNMYVSSWTDHDESLTNLRKKIMNSIKKSDYYRYRGVEVYSSPKMLTDEYVGSVIEIERNKYAWVKDTISTAKIITKSGVLGRNVNPGEYELLKKEIAKKRYL